MLITEDKQLNFDVDRESLYIPTEESRVESIAYSEQLQVDVKMGQPHA